MRDFFATILKLKEREILWREDLEKLKEAKSSTEVSRLALGEKKSFSEINEDFKKKILLFKKGAEKFLGRKDNLFWLLFSPYQFLALKEKLKVKYLEIPAKKDSFLEEMEEKDIPLWLEKLFEKIEKKIKKSPSLFLIETEVDKECFQSLLWLAKKVSDQILQYLRLKVDFKNLEIIWRVKERNFKEEIFFQSFIEGGYAKKEVFLEEKFSDLLRKFWDSLPLEIKLFKVDFSSLRKMEKGKEEIFIYLLDKMAEEGGEKEKIFAFFEKLKFFQKKVRMSFLLKEENL